MWSGRKTTEHMETFYLKLKTVPERNAYWEITKNTGCYYHKDGICVFSASLTKETKRGWTIHTSLLTGTFQKLFLPRENWEVLPKKPKLDD